MIFAEKLRAVRETEPGFVIVAWLKLIDEDQIVIQTYNGVRRFNWLFNLRSEIDRKMLRKALDLPEALPIVAGLNACEGKVFRPETYYKPWSGGVK